MFFIQVHQRFIRADSDRQGVDRWLPPEIWLHQSHPRGREDRTRHEDAQRKGRQNCLFPKYDFLHLKCPNDNFI